MKKKGFTLVEIIVVLLILSIVSAVSVPALLGYIDEGRIKECNANREALAENIVAEQMAREVNGEFDEDGNRVTDADGGFGEDAIKEYIEGSSLRCPTGGKYEYTLVDSEADGEQHYGIKCSEPEHGVTQLPSAGSHDLAFNIEDKSETEEYNPAPTPADPGTSDPDTSGDETKHSYTFKIEPDASEMQVGDTQNFHVRVEDEHGNVVDDSKVQVEWKFSEDGTVGPSDPAGAGTGLDASVRANKKGNGQVSCTVTVTEDDGSSVPANGRSVDVTVHPKEEPKTPSYTVEVQPGELEMKPGEKKDLKDLTVTVTDEAGNTITQDRIEGVTWSYETEDGCVEITPEEAIEALKKGTGKVSCTVTVKNEDGSTSTATGSVDVTVTEPESEPVTEPVTDSTEKTTEASMPEFKIAVDPAAASIELDATQVLTASVVAEEKCKAKEDGYVWWSSNDSVAVVKSGNGSASVTIEARGCGACTIYCKGTAVAEDGATEVTSNQAEVQIGVRGASFTLPAEVLIPVWESTNVNTKLYGSDVGITVPAGGYWSSSNPYVNCRWKDGKIRYNKETGLYDQEDGYITIDDYDQGLTYPLTYNYKGESVTTNARVVYPVYGIDGNAPYGQSFSMDLGEERLLTAKYQWTRTTDGPVLWECSDNSVLHVAPRGTKLSDAVVTALSPGTVTLKASMLNEFKSQQAGEAVYVSYQWTITVAHKPIKGMVAMPLELPLNGGAKKLDIRLIPETGADTSGLTYSFDGYDPSFIEVSSDGMVTPKQVGTATVYIGVYRNGQQVTSGSCPVVVVKPDSTELNAIAAMPVSIELIEGTQAQIGLPGKTGDVNISTVPASASLDGVTYSYESSDAGTVSVDDTGKVTALKKGTNVAITVRAAKGYTTMEAKFYVDVTPDPTKLTGIYLEPSSIDINKNSGAQIGICPNKGGQTVIHPIPATASLEGATIEYSIPNGRTNYATVDENGYITVKEVPNSWEDLKVHINVAKDGCTAQADLGINVKPDLNALAGISLDPVRVEVEERGTVRFSRYPDQSGDVVIYPEPFTEQAIKELQDAAVTYSTYSGNINVSAEGEIKGVTYTGSGGDAMVDVKIGDKIKELLAVNVRETPPEKKTISGIEVPITPWSTLRDYIKAQGAEPLPRTNIYGSAFSVNKNQKYEYYILREGEIPKWKNSYENLYFDEYLKQEDNAKYFIKLKAENWEVKQWNSNLQELTEGDIVVRNGACYVYAGTGIQPDINMPQEQMEQNGFIKIK